MELTEHLGELRQRIVRSILWLSGGACLAYFLFTPVYAFLYHPMATALQTSHIESRIVFTHFTQPFFVVLQISVVSGLIMVSPAVIMELWGFLAPALTREERRPLRWIAPFCIVLFAAGVSLAYWVAKYAMLFFLSYLSWFPKGAVLYQDPRNYVLFMVKLMATFGLVFQLPVVLMFLAWVGILTSALMKSGWRHAVVGISVIGLFVTPSNDAFTMVVMIVPVIILYLGSIWLVQLVERRRSRKASRDG